jgi:acyl carrier protein
MVLGIEQVGRNDNFIELGGHSLLAIQVISRLREALQVDLAMDSIFKSPTVAALANQVVAMFAEQADSETLSAMLAEIEGMSAQ